MSQSSAAVSREVSRFNLDNPFILRFVNVDNGDRRFASVEDAVNAARAAGFDATISEESVAQGRTRLVASWSILGGFRWMS